ncbi:MAG: TraX family protein [Alphaproteobacteria bacterium]
MKKSANKTANYQILSNNSLKIIAIIIMFADHFIKTILSAWFVHDFHSQYIQKIISYDYYKAFTNFLKFDLMSIGFVGMPLFCFLLVEGFTHTKNKKKYFLTMLLFACISELPFDLLFFGFFEQLGKICPLYNLNQNVLFSFVLGICLLQSIELIKKQTYNPYIKFITNIVLIYIFSLIATLFKVDYSYWSTLFIVGFYFTQNNKNLQIIFMFICVLIITPIPFYYGFLGCLPILLYNNKKGELNLKYFFYIFYPTHLIILYLIGKLMYS